MATCARCGRFCCEACLASREPPACAECAPALRDPFQLERPLEVLHAWRVGLQLLRAEGLKVLLLCAVFSLPAGLLQLALPEADDLRAINRSMQLSGLYDLLVGLIATQAMVALFLARASGRALSLGEALRVSSLRWSRGVRAHFRAGLWTVLFTLLLLLPGIWMGTRLFFVAVAVMDSPDDALAVSRRLVDGRFWQTLLFALGTYVALALAMLVVSFFVLTALELLEAPRVIGEVANDFIGRLSVDALGSALTVCGYRMARSSAPAR